EKLATLRRGKLDEFSWASITGLAASLPAMAHSWALVAARSEFSLHLPEFVDFGVTLVFLVLTAVALISGNRGPTSIQYLEAQFGADPDAMPIKRWWLRNQMPSR